MEFKEFTNPLDRDYDINSSMEESSITNGVGSNIYEEQLTDLIGILEDITPEVLAEYNITEEEYYHPTKETINKVKTALGITSNRGR